MSSAGQFAALRNVETPDPALRAGLLSGRPRSTSSGQALRDFTLQTAVAAHADGSWSGLHPPLLICGSRVWAERRPGSAPLPGTHAKPGLPAPGNDRLARAEYGWCSFRDRLPALYRG